MQPKNRSNQEETHTEKEVHTHEPFDASDFVERFAKAWDHPNVPTFVAMLASDVRLTQPVTPTTHGREAAAREFTRLLDWLPDLRGTVDSWSASGDTIMIAWRLGFTLGGSPYELRIVDRIIVRNNVIAEREAYFDSLRFFLTTLIRPHAWLPYLRYRGYLRRRHAHTGHPS